MPGPPQGGPAPQMGGMGPAPTRQRLSMTLIRPDGSVGDVNIVSAKPRGVFERNVQSAVRKWRFQPIAGAQQVTRTFDFE